MAQQITFKHAIGDTIHDRNSAVIGVVTQQTNDSRGCGYWVTYTDMQGVVRQKFIAEVRRGVRRMTTQQEAAIVMLRGISNRAMEGVTLLSGEPTKIGRASCRERV